MSLTRLLRSAPAMPTPSDAPARVSALLLAGGQGTRLQQLTAADSKPAIPFAGFNRIVDFAMANAVRAGLRRLVVATQYAPRSLHHHLPTRWGQCFDPGGLMLCDGRGGYLGTADAARKCWDVMQADAATDILILAADHVYDMDYAAFLAAHRASGAGVTVAVDRVPLAEARSFGVMQTDARCAIRAFAEKPRDPVPMPGSPDMASVSMGVYAFRRDWLRDALFGTPQDGATPALDFGHDVIPRAVAQGEAWSWLLQAGPSGRAYWRDVGTLDALRLAQLDFVNDEPARLPFPGPSSDWYLGRGSIAMPGAVVPQSARLTATLVAPMAQVPPGLVTGDNAAEDARWFTRTPFGTVLITQAMLDRRAAHAAIRRSVTPPSFTSRGLHA